MTDDTFDPRDELASAHLDGETTPVEAEQVAADPELAARVQGFATAREAVRAGDAPVDDERRETAIAAALAAFDAEGAPVTPIARARRPRPARPGWAPLIGVAAAALVAAVLIPLLARGGDDDADLASGGTTTTLASEAFADDAAGGAARSSEAAAPSAAADSELSTAEASTPDLGEHADVDSLAQAVRAYLTSPPTTVPGGDPVPASEAAEACIASLVDQIGTDGGAVLLSGTATLSGREVAVVVETTAQGVRVMHVVDPVDVCAPVTSVEV